VVPHDHRAAQTALAAQRPLVLDRRSAAARSLLDLASRLHAGRIELPRTDAGTRERFAQGARRLRSSLALVAQRPAAWAGLEVAPVTHPLHRAHAAPVEEDHRDAA